jgi:hypothetical protein
MLSTHERVTAARKKVADVKLRIAVVLIATVAVSWSSLPSKCKGHQLSSGRLTSACWEKSDGFTRCPQGSWHAAVDSCEDDHCLPGICQQHACCYAINAFSSVHVLLLTYDFPSARVVLLTNHRVTTTSLATTTRSRHGRGSVSARSRATSSLHVAWRP